MVGTASGFRGFHQGLELRIALTPSQGSCQHLPPAQFSEERERVARALWKAFLRPSLM